MAKSVRASVSKRNKAKLRATVFGPVVDERTARLSAKLQELASQPKPNSQAKTNTEITGMDTQDENIKQQEVESAGDMDIDKASNATKSRSQRSDRIQKRNKKARSSIVFRSHPSKTKKSSKRK